jgi:hypothetical protein
MMLTNHDDRIKLAGALAFLSIGLIASTGYVWLQLAGRL